MGPGKVLFNLLVHSAGFHRKSIKQKKMAFFFTPPLRTLPHQTLPLRVTCRWCDLSPGSQPRSTGSPCRFITSVALCLWGLSHCPPVKKGLLGREGQGRSWCFLHSSPRNIPTRLVMPCCKTIVNHFLLRERECCLLWTT